MMDKSTLAIAVVQRQVMIVQASRTHGPREQWLDVQTYASFGDRLFLASTVPHARISSRDVLAIFPATDVFRVPVNGMLELPPQAFAEYLELSTMCFKRHEMLWSIHQDERVKERWWKAASRLPLLRSC
ncbi:hypothetical protein GLOTRDRAFT_40340 [Gloeophyllum trabeum ATCC 11539]|uniref:Uncharacterized protein n=1 Tax=Gloeophyllum trabeum (strain ATCC 11539 / FP-39264 / Madison 617) TaxID=670483 RepID=S7RPI5_GLOTA|nr:uncharacterized protein GLOTRDRAFT_40340 [Gloeophyllum trabeum ATCC 11539]EPQ56455.1 hypothetical protein GLOTRDRAFT_40340 [Gloeophyllum trabeum ATCC 11539]